MTPAAYLADRDEPCPKCRYNLRGTTAGACPECGWVISIQQLKERAEFAAWRERRLPRDPITTAGLVGSWLGLGWPGAMATLSMIFKGSETVTGARVVVIVLIGAVQLLIVLNYVARFTRMQAWSRTRKTALAAFAWGFAPISVLVFLALSAHT